MSYPVIYPTLRSVVLIAAGAPVAVVLAAVRPQFWAVGMAWAAMLLLLTLLDGLVAARLRGFALDAPKSSEVGAEAEISLRSDFTGLMLPGAVSASLSVDTRLDQLGRIQTELRHDGTGWRGNANLTPNRRGPGDIGRAWLRWRGPLGLAWRQAVEQVDRQIAVLPNIAAIRSPPVQIFLRDAIFGMLARKMRGEGSEFEAISEYQPGMDKRAIDWKVSARHSKLLAKEYDTERNNQIVFALDSGSAMCEPIDGLPRIDRAVSAALLTAYVAMKSGDRARVFSFAAKPQISSPFFAGTRNFFRLQQEAARIDYGASESNFTLALSTLASQLHRRSLIIVFTDFTDPTSAKLMLEAVGRLIDRHLLLFVVLNDNELLGLVNAEPDTSDAVAQSVTASALLRQKRLVITQLQRLGVDVIEADHKQVGTVLINSYMRIKRRGQI